MPSLIIVENSVPFQGLLRCMAEGLGFEVSGVYGNEDDALAGLRLNRPDAVLLDVHLDSGSALAVLAAVKRELPQAAVAVLTIQVDEIFRRHYLRAGANAYFRKDGDLPALRAWLSALVHATPKTDGQVDEVHVPAIPAIQKQTEQGETSCAPIFQ